jgi:hypothetical protein
VKQPGLTRRSSTAARRQAVTTSLLANKRSCLVTVFAMPISGVTTLSIDVSTSPSSNLVTGQLPVYILAPRFRGRLFSSWLLDFINQISSRPHAKPTPKNVRLNYVPFERMVNLSNPGVWGRFLCQAYGPISLDSRPR